MTARALVMLSLIALSPLSLAASLGFQVDEEQVPSGESFEVVLVANTVNASGEGIVAVDAIVQYETEMLTLLSVDSHTPQDSDFYYDFGLPADEFPIVDIDESSAQGVAQIVVATPSASAVAANQTGVVVARLAFRSKEPPQSRQDWSTQIRLKFSSPDTDGESHVIKDDGVGGDVLASTSPAGVTVLEVTVPEPPTITAIEPDDGELMVSFAPGSDGGSTITAFTVSCGSQSATGQGSPIVVRGLDNERSYDCSVSATNSVGQSSLSTAVAATPDVVIRSLNIILIKAAIDKKKE